MTDKPQQGTPLVAWGDDVALRGPDAPKDNGQIKFLIEYLLTVYKRFGNTAVTFNLGLQWGATALWKRDEQRERIEELESALLAAQAKIGVVEKETIERCAKVCEKMAETNAFIWTNKEAEWATIKLEDAAAVIRVLAAARKGEGDKA